MSRLPKPTWSFGDQRDLRNLPGGNADCGQHAAGDVSGEYEVGSVDPNGVSANDQVPAVRTPFDFIPEHGLLLDGMLHHVVPPNAQAVAFVDILTRAFHYGKLEPRNSVSQTDANRYMHGEGGTYSHFRYRGAGGHE